MPDLDLVVSVTRDALGLGPLQLSPGARYFVSGAQFLGAQVQWNRVKASSPFVDGEVTIHRSRPNVTETVGVEIRADSAAELQAFTQELLGAFTQDSFHLNVSVDGAEFVYACEAADYQLVTWTTPRLASLRGQVLFSVPRKPLALSGGY